MKKQTITGQIYSVTASESCSRCEVRVKKNGVFYSLLSLKPNEQGTFQAISDEVEIQGDEKAIILPFNAARSAVVGTGNKGADYDGDLNMVLSSHRESIGLLDSGVLALFRQDELHNEKFSQIENDILEIYERVSEIENDLLEISSGSSLTPEQVEMVSIITNDDFLMFADNLDVSTFKEDLQKLYEGQLSSHLADTSLHGGGGGGSDEVFWITAQSLTGDYLAPPPPPVPDGVTQKILYCNIDLNLLASALESAGYKFCKE